MKVALNGGLNASILDGWWDEAYTPEVGWAIGSGEEYADPDYQDAVESAQLYDLLEKEIIPLFYDRGPDGLPRGWIARMKTSIAANAPQFSTHRMVQDYFTSAYAPAGERYRQLRADGGKVARELAGWKRQIVDSWRDVKIADVTSDETNDVVVGSKLAVRANVSLGSLKPEDLRVELFAGEIDPSGSIVDGQPVPMSPNGSRDGTTEFAGELVLQGSGKRGFTVRVVPTHPGLAPLPEPGLIRWAG
jgi:starch phosphorylase